MLFCLRRKPCTDIWHHITHFFFLQARQSLIVRGLFPMLADPRHPVSKQKFFSSLLCVYAKHTSWICPLVHMSIPFLASLGVERFCKYIPVALVLAFSFNSSMLIRCPMETWCFSVSSMRLLGATDIRLYINITILSYYKFIVYSLPSVWVCKILYVIKGSKARTLECNSLHF